jgi:serine/threonine protein kinase
LKTEDVLHPVLEKLGNTYEYVNRLGGGEFSNVYLLKHVKTGKELALKILDYYFLIQKIKKVETADSKDKFNEIKTRFVTEANLYRKIDHPNIVKIREMGVFEDENEGIEIPYFLMDYVKGSSLDKVIKQKSPLDLALVTRISQDILGALDIIHQNGIVHRDLKPANIMIEADTGNAILIDFGIAKDILSGSRLTTTGTFLGSPPYMSPEQFMDSSTVGPGSDVYSFGVVLFEMLTGSLPFKGTNFIEFMTAHRKLSVPLITEKIPGLPEGLDVISSKAMAKDASDRYKSATELLNALKKADEQKHPGRYIKYIVFITAAVLIIALALIFLVFHKPTPSKPLPPKPTIENKGPDKNKIVENNGSQNSGNTNEQPVTQDDRDKKVIAEHIATAKDFLGKNEFDKALETFNKAKKIKETDELKQLIKETETKKADYEKQNGTVEYNSIKEQVSIEKYLEFKGKYPGSIYIPDLQNKIKTAGPNLPPEKYWDKPVKKNQKGYYEYTFTFDTERNSHSMIYIPEKQFWIDKYEVSNLQFRRYLESEKISAARQRGDGIVSNADDYPVVVSSEEAEKYCRKFGFRLPGEDEWEYAAGKGLYSYPWGNEPPDSGGMYRANCDSLDGTEKDGFVGTAPVKSFERFSSPFGAVNMAGNVWEWVKGKVLKGGGFFSPKEDLVIQKNSRGRENDREGFRCIRDEREGG